MIEKKIESKYGPKIKKERIKLTISLILTIIFFIFSFYRLLFIVLTFITFLAYLYYKGVLNELKNKRLRLGGKKKDKFKEEERKILWQKIKKEREIKQMQQEEERKRFEQERKQKEMEMLERERIERIKQRKEDLKRQKAKQRREKREKLAEENFAKSQREKGLELFEGKWVDKKEIPKLKEIQIGLDKNFQNLLPYEFEKFIAKLFKAMGYETRVTQASNDYGIDVVAEKGNEKIAIQCKRYRPRNPVSNRDIQRLLGAMQLKSIRATHSIIITTSHFTVQAREQAKECAIELWDRHDLEKMVRKYLMKI